MLNAKENFWMIRPRQRERRISYHRLINEVVKKRQARRAAGSFQSLKRGIIIEMTFGSSMFCVGEMFLQLS